MSDEKAETILKLIAELSIEVGKLREGIDWAQRAYEYLATDEDDLPPAQWDGDWPAGDWLEELVESAPEIVKPQSI